MFGRPVGSPVSPDTYPEHELTLEVRDDNKGMGVEPAPRSGIGLRTIQHRVHLLNGTCIVHPLPAARVPRLPSGCRLPSWNEGVKGVALAGQTGASAGGRGGRAVRPAKPRRAHSRRFVLN